MIEQYLDFGYEPIPLPEGKKAHPPKGWTDRKFQVSDFPPNCNVGIHARNFTILDVDAKELARTVYSTLVKRGILTTIVETRRGAQFYFAGEHGNSHDEERKIDRRGKHGYGLAPPSIVDGWAYRFVKGHELVPATDLKPFPEDYLFKRKDYRLEPIKVDDLEMRGHLAREWMKRAKPAISGEGGHDQMFHVACWLFEKFCLTRREVWLLLLEFNERAQPSFSMTELRHKLDDAEILKG